MKTDAITNPTIKGVIEALQNGDRESWMDFFETNAELYDDRRIRTLKEFTDDALGNKRFTSIDSVGE